tara:strand:- start:5940 stop:6431 length:492 start_codon:yes stop_codon:yes gene_type:complete
MKYIIFTISLLTLVSCKDSKNQDTKTETVEHSTETHNEHLDDRDAPKVYTNAWTKEIKMNNGDKWQADAKTNEGVQKMQNTIKLNAINALDDYHQLAIRLNDDKNNVIKNCSMTGASHDNLHIWLLPLIEKIEALSKAKTVEDAAKIKRSIEENINGYDAYFQ